MSRKTISPFIRFATLFTGVRHVCALTSYAKLKNFVLIPLFIDDESHDENDEESDDEQTYLDKLLDSSEKQPQPVKKVHSDLALVPPPPMDEE